MVTIYIDNKPYQVSEGQNLLQACLSLGFDLPYFCWHPAMHSVGACRQCAVKLFRDDKDTRGKIVMSCMTPVAEGLRLSVDDPDARAFRSSVIEWLMLNHPHDCPVCDEGGECHLQDMTVMTGHNYRRTRFKKRTYRNQNLGPFINHEMNRCIQCYRCVRFYRDYAGGRDLQVFASRDRVYFGRQGDGILESEFSGNLVEVCPTGVFTDKTLKQHYTRKWDLQTAPSVCVHCSLGCNIIPGERYGSLRRILNRYHYEVNGYFLCDRGRFGYEFVNSGRRVRKALMQEAVQHDQRPIDKVAALELVTGILTKSKGIIGIGSPRASLESNFALRTLVGPDNFYAGIPEIERRLQAVIVHILSSGPAEPASLRDAAMADAVFVLGEDVANTAPLLSLALRQSARQKGLDKASTIRVPEWDDAAVRNAAQDERSPLFTASVCGTKLDDLAVKTYHAAPDDIARLGFIVAHYLNPDAPPVEDLSGAISETAKEIALALKNAKRPLIVSGTSLGCEAVVEAAANVAWSLCGNGKIARLCFASKECNSMGLALLQGKSLDNACEDVLSGNADTVIVLENDLYQRTDAKKVDELLKSARHVIVIDHLVNRISSKAEIVLPAGTFAESQGTIVNNEGRAQRFYQVIKPVHDVQASWKWIQDIIRTSGRGEVLWNNFDAITSGVADAFPILEPLRHLAPEADFRLAGQKIPRQPHRYSGRTSMLANISVHEPKPPDDTDSPLSFSMEGYEGEPPSSFISRYWSPGWNSVQALNKFQQEVGGLLHGGDPGRRLLERSGGGRVQYYQRVPDAVSYRNDEWIVIPLHHIFGSDELSSLSPGIAHRAPKPYIALNPEDASLINATQGEMAEISTDHGTYLLELMVFPDLPRGVAGLYSTMTAQLGILPTQHYKIKKAS
jgi:NADH-quinone oxidoreductase subunit G